MAKYLVRLIMNVEADDASTAVRLFVEAIAEQGTRTWIYRAEDRDTGELAGYYNGYGDPHELDLDTDDDADDDDNDAEIPDDEVEVLAEPEEPMSTVPLDEATPEEAAAGLPEIHLDDVQSQDELLAFASGMTNSVQDQPVAVEETVDESSPATS